MRRSRGAGRRILATACLALITGGPIHLGAQDGPFPAPLTEELAARLDAFDVPRDSARVSGRSSIHPGLDALLLEIAAAWGPVGWIVFALPEDGAEPPWEIARMDGPWVNVTLDAASSTDVVVRLEDDYGYERNRQFFLDTTRRAVTGNREFSDPDPQALLMTRDSVYAVYDFGEPGRFLLVGGVGSGSVSVARLRGDDPVEALLMRNDTLLVLTETRELYRQGDAVVGRRRPPPLQPAQGVRLLHPRLPQFQIVPGGILETRLADSLLVPVDLPGREEFVRAWPEEIDPRVGFHVESEIGPTAAHRDRVWFGLTFYWGEGSIGVGGLGWFDPEAREAELVYPDSLTRWSVSAIAGSGDGVYVGRVVHPEGADVGGGIGRYDTVTGAFGLWQVEGVVRHLAVRDETIAALTDRGLVVLEPDGRWRRYRLVPEPDGGVRVIFTRGTAE